MSDHHGRKSVWMGCQLQLLSNTRPLDFSYKTVSIKYSGNQGSIPGPSSFCPFSSSEASSGLDRQQNSSVIHMPTGRNRRYFHATGSISNNGLGSVSPDGHYGSLSSGQSECHRGHPQLHLSPPHTRDSFVFLPNGIRIYSSSGCSQSHLTLLQDISALQTG